MEPASKRLPISRKVMNPPEKKPHLCNLCEKKYSKQKSLIKHLLTHCKKNQALLQNLEKYNELKKQLKKLCNDEKDPGSPEVIIISDSDVE